jgi:hypothetical protein
VASAGAVAGGLAFLNKEQPVTSASERVNRVRVPSLEIFMG